MAVNLKLSSPEIRERRLGAVLSYNGSAVELSEKSKEGSLKCLTSKYGQCSDCQEMCATSIVSFVRGSALVAHAPIGCFAVDSNWDNVANASSAARKLGKYNRTAVCTNIQEKDTVYGGIEKLRKAILETYRRSNPTAIFVSTSCASGIIGDDVESLAGEVEDELGIPIIPISCEGFKSKAWATGFDAAFHGILRKIVKAPEKKQTDLVNIINFEGADTFRPLLAKLNLRVQYLAGLATVEELSHISEAAVTAEICETLGTYLGKALEQEYGVPVLKAPSPYGINWTDAWLTEIAKVTGREELAAKVIEEEHQRIAAELNELKEKLAGKSIYIVSGDSYAHNVANIVKDLGLKIAGISSMHHDQWSDNERRDTLQDLIDSVGDVPNYSVCCKQPYQLVKLIQKAQPDFLVVRHDGLTTLGYKLGIPTIFEGDANYSIGYDGVLRMGRRLIDISRIRKFIDTVAEHAELPYSDWWMNEIEAPFYFEGGRKA